MTEPPVKIPITAEDRFSRTFAQLKRDLGDVRGVIGSVTALASRVVLPVGAAVAAVGASGAALKRLADDIDALNDAADATGSSIEKLSVLETIARRNGAGVDLVTSSIVRLNQAINSAKPDSPAARALQAIGVNATELRRLDPADALRAVAEALARFEDNGAKARITQELFGRSVREVAPFLRDMLDAGDVNAKVTARQAAEAEKFSKELSRLQASVQDVARDLTLKLLPSLNGLFDRARDRSLIDYFSELGKTLALRGPVGLIADMERLQRVYEQGVDFKGLEGVRAMRESMTDLQALIDSTFDEQQQALYRQELERTRGEYEALYRATMRLDSRAGGGRGFVNPAAVRPSIQEILGEERQRTSEAQRYLETLRKQAEGYDRLSASGRLFADIEAGRIEGLTPALRRQLELEAARVDALDQAKAENLQLLELQRALNAEKEKEAGIQKLVDEKRQRDLDTALAQLADTTVGRAQRAEQQIGVLRELLNQPGVDADRASQILEAIENIKAGLQDLGDTGSKEFDRLFKAVDDFASGATEAFLDFALTGERSFSRLFEAFSRDVLRELIEDPVKESMRAVVKTIRDELSKLEGADNPIRKLFQWLSESGSSSGSSAGFFSWLGGLFGGAGGSTGRAGGGGVNAGQLVRWQENGREWFVPQENGAVLTQAQLRQMQGASLYAPTTVHVNGDVSPATVAMVRRMLEERDARLRRSMQHGRMRAA